MKIFVFKRNKLILFGICLVCAIAIIVTSQSGVISASAAKRDLPIYCVKRDDKVASLTFDAAWGNEDTQQLIDILGKYNVKATFFVVGDWVEKYPESVKALAEAGHEVMNHSDTHPHMTKISRDEMISQINGCNDKVKAVTGSRPILFRPPFGDYNNTVVQTLRSLNMYTIQWDVDSLDWKDLSAPEIQKRVLTKVKPGSIILFHNAAKHTPEALPGIIEKLQNEGYTLVPVSKLIYADNFTIDHAGTQIPNKSPQS